MNYSIVMFWLLLVAMVGGSGYFTYGVITQRAAAVNKQASLESGDVVRLERVLDGDTVVVRGPDAEKVIVRILGIKAFRPDNPKDPAAAIGRRGVRALERLLADQPLRVLLHETPRDRHGRTLAKLLVGDRDVGLEQLKAGLALVYTVYPFPAMSLYLEAQEQARQGRRGLWEEPALAERARGLMLKWGAKAK